RVESAYVTNDGDTLWVVEGVSFKLHRFTLHGVKQGVLSFADDADGDPLVAEVVESPSHGNLVQFGSDGAFMYVSDAGYTGPDEFTYRISDPFGGSTLATARIEVIDISKRTLPPMARDDYWVTPRNTTLIVEDGSAAPLNVKQLESWTFDEPVVQIVYIETYQLLALRTNRQITLLDARTREVVGQLADVQLSDMDVSPNGRYLFAVSNPLTEAGIVHRFDCIQHEWVSKVAIASASRIEAVDADHVILSGSEGVLYERFGRVADNPMSLLARSWLSARSADIEYESKSRMLFVVKDSNVRAILVGADTFTAQDLPASYEPPHDYFGPPAILSSGGKRVYVGRHGFLSADLTAPAVYIPDTVRAASDQIVIGSANWFNATDGTLLAQNPSVRVDAAAVAANGRYAWIVAQKQLSLYTLGGITHGVLANDLELDTDPASAELVSAPQHGTLQLSSRGGFTYVPEADFTGYDEFSYRAIDSDGPSLPAKVVIQVGNSPIAATTEDSLSTDRYQAVSLDASPSYDPEGAALTYAWAIVSAPAGSSAIIVDALHVTTSFVPDVAGTYQFALTVNDGLYTSEPHEVTIVAKENVRTWTNPSKSTDVNNDGYVYPIDALMIINEINSRTMSDSVTGRILETRPADAAYFDVNNDGFITPSDVLQIIAVLNRSANSRTS
ncbi:MAG: tandem-95 repeat protein, partial [Planctomycetales bacterium]|nr:tandem-95 repeat protein [Planctomycetales bacterium]